MSRMYTHVDVSLAQWRALILTQYPTAKFHVAPEEFGGTNEAYDGNEFVGDWDGSGDDCGRIKNNLQSTKVTV